MLKGFVAAALWLVSWAAAAQTPVIEPSEAQKLACLTKATPGLQYPDGGTSDRGRGTLRVALRFDKPDAEPSVQVVYNTAQEDLRDLVLKHVSSYRLPCLKPADGGVNAVQEFTFRDRDSDPIPVPAFFLLIHQSIGGSFDAFRAAVAKAGGAEINYCLVVPPPPMALQGSPTRRSAEHVVAQIKFVGDGQQPPEVTVVYENASERFAQAARGYLASFRMPCRTSETPLLTMTQRVTATRQDKPRYGLSRDQSSLADFLAMAREPAKLKAYFDFNTMGCPFKVKFTIGNDVWPHDASSEISLNRVAFLDWLKRLQLKFESEQVANDVFGSQIQIDVPCGTLDLKGPPAPAGS